MSLELLRSRISDTDIQSLIRAKAAQVIHATGFGPSDREDVEQALRLRLLERLHAYDPTKASLYCFALVVIDRQAKTLIEHRQAACRNPTGTTSLDASLPSEAGESASWAGRIASMAHDRRLKRQTDSDEVQQARSLDVDTVLSRLPGPQQQVARRLLEASPAQLAREMQTSRYHLQQQIKQIRAAFRAAGYDEPPFSPANA